MHQVCPAFRTIPSMRKICSTCAWLAGRKARASNPGPMAKEHEDGDKARTLAQEHLPTSRPGPGKSQYIQRVNCVSGADGETMITVREGRYIDGGDGESPAEAGKWVGKSGREKVESATGSRDKEKRAMTQGQDIGEAGREDFDMRKVTDEKRVVRE
ncbi:hypothetical protein C8R43DRAFT_942028 [Mycena crocata]|nr:hypothetical protein C8R43DRAFT_942028 [Mycena crocata]